MERGTTSIANEVVEKIAGIAAREVPGVYDLGGDVARMFAAVKERIGLGDAGDETDRGMRVRLEGTYRSDHITLVIEYGFVVYSVAEKVRTKVISAVENLLGPGGHRGQHPGGRRARTGQVLTSRPGLSRQPSFLSDRSGHRLGIGSMKPPTRSRPGASAGRRGTTRPASGTPTSPRCPGWRSSRSTGRRRAPTYPGFERIGWPGEFPYTRGLYPTGYRGRTWTIRQFAGFGNARADQRAVQDAPRRRRRRAVASRSTCRP